MKKSICINGNYNIKLQKKGEKMIDLSYKSYTNKDYMVDEVFKLINANNFVHKVNRNELRKLTTNTLLILLSKLQEKK